LTAILACSAVFLVTAGCNKAAQGPIRAGIQGHVKLDGQPVEHGSILFTPVKGVRGTTAGGPIEDGRYVLQIASGPSLGMNRVEITSLKKTGKKIPKPYPAHGEMIEEQVEAIPAQFNSASTLKFEVKPGENTTDFDLNSHDVVKGKP
jgi:hypothetical protein